MKSVRFCVSFLAAALAVGAAHAQLPRPKPKPSPTRTGATAGTKVLFRADRDATLSIDGQTAGRLEAGKMKSATLGAGEHLIEAQLVADAKMRLEDRLTIAAGQGQLIHDISFTAAEARVATLIDGLQWAKKDNGRDVDWTGAKHYCEELILAGHQDWRLPTIDELQKMYDPASTSEHKVRGGVDLSAEFVWSSTLKESSSAWGFNFGIGDRVDGRLEGSYIARAMCVRALGQ